LLYSSDSLRALALNDSKRYEDYGELMHEMRNMSSRSVFLLNERLKYRKFIEY